MSVTAVQETSPVGWTSSHGLTADEACAGSTSIRRSGLDTAEAERRRAEVGSTSRRRSEPAWQAFLRQYRDLMQLVLLGAAFVSTTRSGRPAS
jgi:Ca2+-transporting ATPase